MHTTVKSELKLIADHLSANASYEDAMYELYVHMKIAQSKKSASAGRTLANQDVRQQFLRGG